MASDVSRNHMEVSYFAAAQEYLRKLPLERFMEATPQSTQREITLESLALVKAQRRDFHVFNELLVQYPVAKRKRPGQVVPDNMIVLHDGPLQANTSYDVPLQPAGPFWVLEYVSKGSKRKDYDDNREHYERQLKVPYYLHFYPETQDLSLFRHNGEKYVSVLPNERGRLALPEVELEVAILGGWVRYWFRGELLPLPADLLHQLTKVTKQRDELKAERDEFKARSDQVKQQLQTAEQDNARLRAELERLRGGGA
jgi:Uma2 family endonuclease